MQKVGICLKGRDGKQAGIRIGAAVFITLLILFVVLDIVSKYYAYQKYSYIGDWADGMDTDQGASWDQILSQTPVQGTVSGRSQLNRGSSTYERLGVSPLADQSMGRFQLDSQSEQTAEQQRLQKAEREKYHEMHEQMVMQLSMKAVDASDPTVRKRLINDKLNLSVGNPVTIKLLENSSTGYIWIVETVDCAAMGLQVDEEIFYSGTQGGFPTGIPDIRLVTLRAMAGNQECLIKLEQKRPWDTTHQALDSIKFGIRSLPTHNTEVRGLPVAEHHTTNGAFLNELGPDEQDFNHQ